MHARATLVIAFCVAVAACRQAPTVSAPATTMKYPQTHKGDVVDDYSGTKIPDPYRWMEDLDAKEVAAWVGEQNAVTEAHLAALPLRSPLKERLTALWDYPRTGLPQIENGQLFYSKNSGLQRQAPIYMRAGAVAEPKMVLDPNTLSPDGSLSLAQYAPSPDAKQIAYAIAEGGADWETVKVRDLVTSKDLADDVRWMRFSGL